MLLERYREKKRRRGDGTTVRYQARQVNAVARPRIKGRFAKPEELAELLAHEQVAPVTVFAAVPCRINHCLDRLTPWHLAPSHLEVL